MVSELPGSCRRVLLWSDAFPPQINGVATFMSRLVPALVQRGLQIEVITQNDQLDEADSMVFAGARVWRFPFLRFLAERRLDQCRRMLDGVAKVKRSFAPDVVHLHSVSPSLFFHLQTNPARATPSVFSLHENLPEGTAAPDGIVGQALRAVDWLTTNSDAVLKRTRSLVPELGIRSSIIHHGMDLTDLLPSPLPFAQPKLVCVSRLVEEKGIDVALRAMTHIRRHWPQARLVIAGEGPARPELERLTAELGLEQAVRFDGPLPLDQVLALMNTATIVLLPSRCEEAFGLVAMEAAATARPVIATRVGGIPEIVLHGETGLLIANGDSRGLAAAAAYLLNHPEKAVGMGQQARQRIVGSFPWAACVDAHLALYERLAQQASNGKEAARTVPGASAGVCEAA